MTRRDHPHRILSDPRWAINLEVFLIKLSQSSYSSQNFSDISNGLLFDAIFLDPFTLQPDAVINS